MHLKNKLCLCCNFKMSTCTYGLRPKHSPIFFPKTFIHWWISLCFFRTISRWKMTIFPKFMSIYHYYLRLLDFVTGPCKLWNSWNDWVERGRWTYPNPSVWFPTESHILGLARLIMPLDSMLYSLFLPGHSYVRWTLFHHYLHLIFLDKSSTR